MTTRSGFTLIELSIVLVIIGLIAGGVLVGRDLIQAATIRATVSQIQKYEAAVNTFRTKYNYLPGDIPAAQAAQTGLIARGGGDGDGNGDGLIVGLDNVPFSPLTFLGIVGGETVFFWTDLSSAGLIDGAFTDSSDAFIHCQPCTDLSRWLPAAKTGHSGHLFAFHNVNPSSYNAPAGTLLFQLFATLVGTGANGSVNAYAALATQEAYAIDSKTDDGLPLKGSVLAGMPGRAGSVAGFMGSSLINALSGTGDQFCVSNDAASYPYNLAYPESLSCGLIVRTGI